MDHLAEMMFAAFAVKHFICDFPHGIQTPWMYLNKGTYGHLGGITHALVHVAASFDIFLVFGFILVVNGFAGSIPLMWGISCALLFFEFLVHYHMDWFKVWW